MNISTEAIVSNSEMMKNYKACREKAEYLGKLFVLKNNQPDAVLFSISEYERLSVFIEYLESLEEVDLVKVLGSLSTISPKNIIMSEGGEYGNPKGIEQSMLNGGKNNG